MKLLPLLLLVSSVCWTNATKFEANGAMQCHKSGHPWCFWLTFYELDQSFKDDKLDAIGAKCTREKAWHYHLEGEEDGDGLYNNFYEVALHVRHNCTKYGEYRDFWKYEDLYPISTEKISVEWSPVLNNKGTKWYE
uniref:Uncharacterized protein n=1 Tax=Caenorhabditis japonica TaxID=281687 RepID=A0A8R1HR40_CAEJA